MNRGAVVPISSARISNRFGNSHLAMTYYMTLMKAAATPWIIRVRNAQTMKNSLFEMQSQKAMKRNPKLRVKRASRKRRLVPQHLQNEGQKKERILGAPQMANTQPTTEAETPLSSARSGKTVRGAEKRRKTLEVGRSTPMTRQHTRAWIEKEGSDRLADLILS